MAKLLSWKALLISFVMLINGTAYAERICTRTIEESSDGTRKEVIECSIDKTKNPDIIRNPRTLMDKVKEIIDNSNQRLQQFKDRTANVNSKQDDTHEKASEIRQKQQDYIDSMRARAEMQKERMRSR